MANDPLLLHSIGVDQPPWNGARFPLVDPEDMMIFRLADFNLEYIDDDVVYEPPFRVDWMYRVTGFWAGAAAIPGYPAPTHEADIIIVDGLGQRVFDSTVASRYDHRLWGTRLGVRLWQTDSAICQLVYHAVDAGEVESEVWENLLEIWESYVENWEELQQQGLTDYPPLPEYYQPVRGMLDARTVQRQAKSVRRVFVGNQILSGDIEITNGYNTTLDVVLGAPDDGARSRQVLTLNGDAGSGLGRFPGCGNVDRVIRFIKQVGPTPDGRFFLDGDPCYRIERPTGLLSFEPPEVAVSPNTLRIRGQCKPCCDCGDYANTYKATSNLFWSYYSLGTELEQLRDLHAANIARWNKEKECIDQDFLRVAVFPFCPCRAGVAISFCNHSDGCAAPLTLEITMSRTGAGDNPTVDCSTTRVSLLGSHAPYALSRLSSSDPWIAEFPAVTAKAGATLSFRANIPSCVAGDTLTVDVLARWRLLAGPTTPPSGEYLAQRSVVVPVAAPNDLGQCEQADCN